MPPGSWSWLGIVLGPLYGCFCIVIYLWWKICSVCRPVGREVRAWLRSTGTAYRVSQGGSCFVWGDPAEEHAGLGVGSSPPALAGPCNEQPRGRGRVFGSLDTREE